MHKTRSALCSRFYWYGMSVDIGRWIQECDQCQKVDKPLTTVQTLQCIKVSAVWELVGIDLTGPLPKTTVTKAESSSMNSTQGFVKTLHGTQWLSDEVIDAYLQCIIEEHKKPVYHIDSVVGTSLFSGRFRSLSKMKFPVEECWLCPLNFSAHWILVIVDIPTLTLVLIDPMGNEDYYDRKVLRNWRNFLKMMGRSTESWQAAPLCNVLFKDWIKLGYELCLFQEVAIVSLEKSARGAPKSNISLCQRLNYGHQPGQNVTPLPPFSLKKCHFNSVWPCRDVSSSLHDSMCRACSEPFS
ncbi:hypothetical protein ACEWY4_021564 [Coilia grayii]|uniref:Ubiquitin-like protease family profile domain-containing protein n=1 Tax=Coilia grayii TaxID=363190 RepID=A0ABD1JAP3_9TELE